MADITPEVSLTSSVTPEVSIGGKVTVPEVVYLQGLQGEQGAPGPKGDTGAQGEQGEKGDAFTYADFTEEQLAALKGPKGDTGAKGDKGDQGPQGEPGEKGAPGEAGHSPAVTAEKTGKVTTIKVDGVVVATISDGVVSTVNSKAPDDSGNVALTGGDIPMSADDGTTLSAAIGAKLSSAAGAVGTGNLGANVVTRAKMAADAFTLADNAGAHNAIYGGRSLGSSVTAAQWAAIQAGTFEDLFIGDYWTINGVNWRIAAFDYYYNTGDVLCTTHHVVIVPDSCLIHTAKWNNAGNTTGAYVSSTAYTTHVPAAQTTIAAAFGSDHILSHRKNFANATANGIQSAASWYDNSVALMTQANVYGNLPFGPASNGTNFPYNHSIDCIQYPLFAYAKEFIRVGEAHWLRDVLTAKRVAMVGAGGECNGPNADNAFGIRPAFSIKA